MSISYQNSSDLMKDPVFLGRIKVACLYFADYITNEDPKTPAHNSRAKWAASCFQSPDTTASTVAPVVVMDPNVQDQGAEISDADLQSATENALNKMI